MRSLLIVACTLFAGCGVFEPNIATGIPCTPEGRCPDDQSCDTRTMICVDVGGVEDKVPDASPPCETCDDSDAAPGCGDGTCDNAGGETCSTCTQDCGDCCGDQTCDAAVGETCATCPADCACMTGSCNQQSGACEAMCGNSMCETGESFANCPSDCQPVCPAGYTFTSSFGGTCLSAIRGPTTCAAAFNDCDDEGTEVSSVYFDTDTVGWLWVTDDGATCAGQCQPGGATASCSISAGSCNGDATFCSSNRYRCRVEPQ